MYIKPTQKFKSKESDTVIKVTKVNRSYIDNRRDVCVISDCKNGRVIAGTRRAILADSIRRRYWPI